MKYKKKRILSLAVAGFLLIAGSFQLSLAGSNYPVDYYAGTERSRKLIKQVEKHHFNQNVQTLRSGQNNPSPYKDLDFVLRYIPNHPKALQLMEIYLKKTDNYKQITHGMVHYYSQAIQVNPQAAITRILFAGFLQRSRQASEALEQYKAAGKLPEMGRSRFIAHYRLAEMYKAMGKDTLKEQHIEEAEKYARNNHKLIKKLESLR